MHGHPTERICTEHSHVNSIRPFTGFQVLQQESCTNHSQVYNIWLFRIIDLPQKESAPTTVMSTVFVNILAQRFEEIICTEHSHANSIWLFTVFEASQQEPGTDHSHVHDICILTCIDIPQKVSAQTTVISTVFVNILVYKFEDIICTERSHVNSIWPFIGFQVSQQ